MRWADRSGRASARYGAEAIGRRGAFSVRGKGVGVAIVAWIACVAGSGCSVQTTGGSTGGGAHADPGDTVATFELGAPSIASFTLHGTLPVPAHTLPRADGLVPFQVRDFDGTLVPTQVGTVSRYAADADGADVVELIARVHAAPGTAPGTRIRYDVVFQPTAASTFAADSDVRALITTPGSLVLRTHDVFQNEYTLDLLADWRAQAESVRVLKNGGEAVQFVTHGSLVPVVPTSGPTGTLPHLMGVHAYVTQWAGEQLISLDLRVHDAHSGLSQTDTIDDALGKIYFDALELEVPPGWQVLNSFPDPYFGGTYEQNGRSICPIVQPIPGRKMHVMPEMSQFERRLVLYHTGAEARAASWQQEEGIAFCTHGTSPSGFELWSWWNPLTARYFPQRQRLPTLDHVGLDNLRQDDLGQLGVRALQVQTGSTGPWPAESAGLGWAHPWGIQVGGMVSGLEIHLYEGITTACAASNAGYRYSQLVHRMLTDRQPNVLFDADGRPTRLEEWLIQGPNGPLLPIWWYGGPMLWASDPFGITTSPSFQRDAVQALGLQPDWEPTLLGYQAIDLAHLIRYTRLAKVLAWLGNDALAKDDLRAQAEGMRMGYNMYRQNSYPQGVISTGMLVARTYVDAHPGWGFPFGRGEGWGLDTVCASYSLGEPAWRELVRPWFDLVTDLVHDGQMHCTGIIQASPMINIFGSQYRCRQSIEAAITENAMVGMRESVFRGENAARVSEVNGVLSRALYAMISPLIWDHTIHGPWAMIADGLIDMNQPPFCTYWPPDGNYGIPDHYQTWSSYAYAYQITHDGVFLQRAVEALGGGDLKADLMAKGTTDLENGCALLAFAQTLP
jgi:hypothetical protein